MSDTQRPTVYGTGWCPDVARSRALLDRRGITYDYVDVDADRAAAKRVYRLQRGTRRVPTIVLADGTVLVEPTDDELAAALDTRT